MSEGKRTGDGPRSRRMIRGTIARIGGLGMRHGHPSQLATLECTSSRRSTVLGALSRATAVTTVYQRDSSSKRPRSSVVFAARAPNGGESHVANAASRASRPAGGASGAPGHRARHVGRALTRNKLTLAAQVSAGHSEDGGLTEGHSISASRRQRQSRPRAGGSPAGRAKARPAFSRRHQLRTRRRDTFHAVGSPTATGARSTGLRNRSAQGMPAPHHGVYAMRAAWPRATGRVLPARGREDRGDFCAALG